MAGLREKLVLGEEAAGKGRLVFWSVCVAAFLALLWSQALHVPFWQDDYYFLLDAQRARLAGEPWYAPFFPAWKVPWWRPLGERVYWRFIEGVLGGTVLSAHVTNICLLLVGAASVGWFVSALLELRVPKGDSVGAGVFAALLYGVHSSHFLPAAWASAANASLSVSFAAVALRAWLAVLSAEGRKAALAAPVVVVCFALALLSRDICIVLPALGALLTLWPRTRCRHPALAWGTGVVAVAVALVWVAARHHFTLPTDPAFQLRVGSNVLRNAGVLVLFVLNVPFEALRFFFFVRPSAATAAWGLSCFALQAGALLLLLRGAREHLDRKDFLWLAAFFVLGCAPAFFLSVNCYPYYTSIGLFAYALIAGFAWLRGRMLPGILLLVTLASAVATLGNFFLDSPSHVGRARWAERQLVRLEAMREARPDLFLPPLEVSVEDEHRFLGLRVEGLAYRLGIGVSDISLREPSEAPAARRPILVVPREGDVYFKVGG